MINNSPARLFSLRPLATGGGRGITLPVDAPAALSIQITALRYPKISRQSGGRWWPGYVGAPLTLLRDTCGHHRPLQRDGGLF